MLTFSEFSAAIVADIPNLESERAMNREVSEKLQSLLLRKPFASVPPKGVPLEARLLNDDVRRALRNFLYKLL